MSNTTIGLIGAMDEEIQLMLEQLKNVKESQAAGIIYYEGQFKGKSLVLCKSGVGKVNAAVCTQLLIDRYRVNAVLFTGVAGAVDPSLNIGDIVISTECLQHDMDVTALGYERGIIPFAAVSRFTADPTLVALAEASCARLFDGRSVKGIVLSGDQFVADRDKVRDLYESMQGACTEMEGAAVAQVCSMNGVPYVVIRSMSDKADGSAHVNFGEFTIQASENSHRIVEDMIASM
ncbi:MTA/SAH nucleosidase [Paenibacillus swuensis]|uniref:adenosylhomocysteine nucleosidase n=1 Tax=Paenibacillus swuensis TaxID=1178515 RepID=A0A172TK66_9BACL|nr:5'-methylthioadenosine/adenosylhomocysteine nucleosidase [Paenibacillus swuensis]ANE47441.1 MTA/SAH nucleosidase [Paenibacillus swuensis]